LKLRDSQRIDDIFYGLIEYAEFVEEGNGIACDHEKAESLLAEAHKREFMVNQHNHGW
jgi:hypothetical protein